jgi:hypothetical protein
MSKQRALAAPAAAHDDENVAMGDRERQVPLDDEVTIRHRQVLDRDVRIF